MLGAALRNGGKETRRYRGRDGRPGYRGFPRTGDLRRWGGGEWTTRRRLWSRCWRQGAGGYGGEDIAGSRWLQVNRSLCELASVGSDRDEPEMALKSGAQKGAGCT